MEHKDEEREDKTGMTREACHNKNMFKKPNAEVHRQKAEEVISH